MAKNKSMFEKRSRMEMMIKIGKTTLFRAALMEYFKRW
jgi:hypothetical protein